MTPDIEIIRDLVSDLAQRLYRGSGFLLFYGFLMPEHGRLEMIHLRSATDFEAVNTLRQKGEGRKIRAWAVAYEASLSGSPASAAQEAKGERAMATTSIAGPAAADPAERCVLMHFGDRQGRRLVVQRGLKRRRLRPMVDVTDSVTSPFTGLFTVQ